jgi:SAM-dependent methyltransferase
VSESTTSAEFFEQKYRENPDPWDFAGSEYERSRYEATIAALGTRRYERAFEPGCSVGELTWRLAQHCELVVAMDISETAVEQAKRRCSELGNVVLSVGGLPHYMPQGEFDLLVFSEIGYYFDETELEELAKMLVGRITKSGNLLAVHWLGRSKDHVLRGDRVHEILSSLDGLRLDKSEWHEKFRLNRWVRI